MKNVCMFTTERLGNGQQGFPKQFIGSTSFKSFSTFKKNETLAVRFTRLLCSDFIDFDISLHLL